MDLKFIKTSQGRSVLITLAVLSFLCLILGIYNTILMRVKRRKKYEVIAAI